MLEKINGKKMENFIRELKSKVKESFGNSRTEI